MDLNKPRITRFSGFSLIELLVVLVILGLLGGIVGPAVMSKLGGAKTDTAKAQIEDLAASLDLFRLDVGRYPTSDEGLQALVEPPSDAPNWAGPYLRKKKVPLDPWGQEYYYRSPGEHGEFDIASLGSDKSEGGEGESRDVVSWE